MKAISIWQPWASLVIAGLKRCETRGWGTTYRGPLLIHASLTTEGFTKAPLQADRELGCSLGELPRGCLLGQVELVDCQPITPELLVRQSRLEQEFGWWVPGRFAWVLEEARKFGRPIPWRGCQGLFEVDLEEVIASEERSNEEN